MTEIYIYVFVTLLISIYLTIKNNSDNKFITFIIAYWILAGSALSAKYFIIDFRSLPFDFQPNRIVFIIFSLFLLHIYISRRKSEKANINSPKFEKYLYLYIFFFITVDTIHTINILSLKDLIVNSTGILTFLVVYLVLKKTVDKEMLKVFGKAFLIVCTLSSLIGMYQFFVDPLFFRLGSERVAFLTFLRANGVFHAEYNQSYFLIPGIFIVLFTVHKKILKYLLISLFLVGILLTFHRMSWIISILIFSLYFIRVKKKRIRQLIGTGFYIGLAFIYFSSIFSINWNKITSHDLFRERLMADTMTVRIDTYKTFLSKISQSWLIGFGSKKSDFYYYGMLEADSSREKARGEKGSLENIYLTTMFFRGIPVMILFIFFVFSALYYFWNLTTSHVFYFIPLFEVIKYIMANMTNSITLSMDIGLLLAMFIAAGVAIFQRNIDVTEITVNVQI